MPPLRLKMLPRDHLIDRLHAGRDNRLILVTGSAGSGKTSIVCQWLEKSGLDTAWYSLDEADNDPDLFFRYFLTSLGKVDGHINNVMDPWLQGQKRIVAQEMFPYLSTEMASLNKDIYVVLDDFHLITSSEIHGFLSNLINQVLPVLHLIVISRRAMPFSVSRLKVRNQMMEITAQDMKLTYKETERFFREIMPVKLSSGQVQELTRHMEGWVGGLQLFSLSLQGRKTVDVLDKILSKASEEAADYLIDEVVTTQPEKMKSFLYATTHLARFNVELCREVTGSPDAAEILEEALKNNLFLVPLDTEGNWYRYHNLFSKAVRRRLHKKSGDGAGSVYRIAALWFARNGYLEDAFRHAFDSKDFEFAADLLEDFLMVLYDRYEIVSFRRWIHKLPRDVFSARALLRLFDCRIRIESVYLTEVSEILDDIEEHQDGAFSRYEGQKRELCEDLLLVLRRVLPDWYDPEAADIENLEKALRQISPTSKALSAFWNTVPFSYFYKGKILRAASALNNARTSIFSSGSPSAIMIWYRVNGTVERYMGHLCRSESIMAEAIHFFSTSGLPQPQPRFMVDLQVAWIHYQRNDVEKALEIALSVVRYVEQTRFSYEIADVYHLLALVYLSISDTDKLERSIQKMMKGARDIGTPSHIALAEAQIARLAIAQGNSDAGDSWLGSRGFSVDELFSLRFVTESLAYTELLTLHGRVRETLGILDTLRRRCSDESMMEAVLEIDVIRTGNLCTLGETEAAKAVLKGALEFSESEGYLRPFVNRAGAIKTILAKLVAPSDSGSGLSVKRSYLDSVIRACGLTESDITGSKSNMARRLGDLTHRETEILELMASGLRDKEIAEKAFISLHTAKTHIKHIFEKLDVTTRVQAIRRAEEIKKKSN
jgi:LuxR family transcriptional regulator, maltose regulon positive regulatory protein